jgi:hypothetical protein
VIPAPTALQVSGCKRLASPQIATSGRARRRSERQAPVDIPSAYRAVQVGRLAGRGSQRGRKGGARSGDPNRLLCTHPRCSCPPTSRWRCSRCASVPTVRSAAALAALSETERARCPSVRGPREGTAAPFPSGSKGGLRPRDRGAAAEATTDAELSYERGGTPAAERASHAFGLRSGDGRDREPFARRSHECAHRVR